MSQHKDRLKDRTALGSCVEGGLEGDIARTWEMPSTPEWRLGEPNPGGSVKEVAPQVR